MHSYEIEVKKNNVYSYIDVTARNRSQARLKAEKLGYDVQSVNFTG